jgi:hypothetical protein
VGKDRRHKSEAVATVQYRPAHGVAMQLGHGNARGHHHTTTPP